MILVFDTETTGLAEFKLPPEHDRQPRLVQLGAILYDKERRVRAEANLIVKPEGFEVPLQASNVHGMTTKIALEYGMSEKAVLQLFLGMCRKATTLVAHNIQYDGIVIGRALHIHGMKHEPPSNKVCTMLAMTEICKLPGNYGKYKWPQLQEAYKHIFGENFVGAHDAMADVRACAEVYFWLQDNQPSKDKDCPL